MGEFFLFQTKLLIICIHVEKLGTIKISEFWHFVQDKPVRRKIFFKTNSPSSYLRCALFFISIHTPLYSKCSHINKEEKYMFFFLNLLMRLIFKSSFHCLTSRIGNTVIYVYIYIYKHKTHWSCKDIHICIQNLIIWSFIKVTPQAKNMKHGKMY